MGLSLYGLLIAFDGPVRNADIHRHSFIVLRGSIYDPDTGSINWSEISPNTLSGVRFANDCVITNEFEIVTNPDEFVNGAQFFTSGGWELGREYRVIVKGDFIRGENELAVDADHLPPWLPARITGDQIEGGTFESWFFMGE
jgi:hypothetical protein